MALTTVSPSPAPGICKSVNRTSYFCELMSFSAPLTSAAQSTSKPCFSRIVHRPVRIASSSSTTKTRASAIGHLHVVADELFECCQLSQGIRLSNGQSVLFGTVAAHITLLLRDES